MKTPFRIAAIAAVFCSLIAFTGYGQATETETAKRTIGLSANVQNSEFGITVPIFLSQQFVLAPAIGLRYAENVGTDFAFAIIPKIYFSTDRFAPYLLFRLGFITNKPAINVFERQTDLLAGVGTGAEYFLIPNFSFGVEGQLNIVSSAENSNRFGNPNGTNINLATAVTANIYFTR